MDALADIIGTTKQVLSRYENGDRIPKISMAKKIADSLQISLAEIMGEEEASQEDDEVMRLREDMRRNPALRTLWDMTRNATPKEMKQFEAFIRAIKGSEDE